MKPKTTISAKIVADSKNTFGERITTMVVTFPRFILAELNTHRMFSRNSASSRAIPFEKMLASVQNDPFIPIAWQKDHKGMQGTEYWDDKDLLDVEKGVYSVYPKGVAVSNWLTVRDEVIKAATTMNNVEITKQLCNRLLEAFMWHTVLITSTEFSNFFALRCPIYEIDDEMLEKLK